MLHGGDSQYTTHALALVPVSSDQCSLWLCLFKLQEIHREKRFHKLRTLSFLLEHRLYSLRFFKCFLSMFSEIYREDVSLN